MAKFCGTSNSISPIARFRWWHQVGFANSEILRNSLRHFAISEINGGLSLVFCLHVLMPCAITHDHLCNLIIRRKSSILKNAMCNPKPKLIRIMYGTHELHVTNNDTIRVLLWRKTWPSRFTWYDSYPYGPSLLSDDDNCHNNVKPWFL